MSKRRSKAVVDDDEEVSLSSNNTISSLEDAVKECVRFMVNREGSKIPIKRAEVIQHLASSCQTPSNLVNSVITKANETLKKIYGYKLVQITTKSSLHYILVLNEECESLPTHIPDSNHRKLLVAALLHIFMSGGTVKEDDMWKFLAEAGLLEETDYTSRKILIHTFTRQMYLSHTKVGEGDLAKYMFGWGQRATEEVPKIFLLKKMAEALNKTPEYWSEQYKQATEVPEREHENANTTQNRTRHRTQK